MKLTLSWIVTFIHACLGLHTEANKNDFLRIRGGRNATEGEFPYVVKLILQSLLSGTPDNKFLCSGAALASRWTLTAAHCVHGTEQLLHQQLANGITQIKAVIEYQVSPKGDFAYSDITSMSVAPNAKAGSFLGINNDVALLHTQPVMTAKYVKLSPIDYAALTGQKVSLVGYGMFSGTQGPTPPLPQVLEVIVKKCSAVHLNARMCFAPSCDARGADGANWQTICPGDSGGPAVHESGVVSVHSAVDIRECGLRISRTLSRRFRHRAGYEAGIATPISPYVDWISNVMNTDIVV